MLKKSERRFGAAAVEFAVLAPILTFLFVIAVDWARIFYYSVVVSNCARNGALYSSDAQVRSRSPYASVTEAALADAPDVSPSPTVTSTSGSDTNGSYVEVTVSFPFKTVTNFPGVPATTTIVRTVRMQVSPLYPNF